MRIIGEHFTKEGKAKRGYAREEDAREVADKYGQIWYLCEFCHEYHCANPPS